MSIGKKIFFALLTFALLACAVEGIARVVWWKMESEAFASTKKAGEQALRNDGINFMKQSDGLYAYTLKPGFSQGSTYINEQGFFQRDFIPVERQPNSTRLIALGESTTQGSSTDNGNYPIYLRQCLEKYERPAKKVEVINAGVAGWVSDQVALRAEHQLAAYCPDITVLSVGWNDFQSYDPLEGTAPSVSYFEQYFAGKPSLPVCNNLDLKSVTLLSAFYQSIKRKHEPENVAPINSSGKVLPKDIYRFYLHNLDRIVNAFQKKNPDCEIVLCTLVGRWPCGTLKAFKSDQGRTWWMKKHGVTPVQAEQELATFNNLIRTYAKEHSIMLVDADNYFSNLDRSKLQWDFAHMNNDGYQLLADLIYDNLRKSSIVQGAPNLEFLVLTKKYQLPDQKVFADSLRGGHG